MMSPGLFPVILDILVLFLLAGTIYFAVRLSSHLRVFSESRGELEKILGDLSANILRAEAAIDGLRQTAREAGRDLQQRINDGREVSQELQIMTESGNNIAGRLETAVKSKRAPSPSLRPEREEASARSAGGFAIRDPEFGIDDEEDDNQDKLFMDDADDEGGSFQSRAEKDLFEALSGRRRKAGAGSVS